MEIATVYPCVLINLVRPQTGSSLWDICPSELMDDLLNHNVPDRCIVHFNEKYPNWQLTKWIVAPGPQTAINIVEKGFWPE